MGNGFADPVKNNKASGENSKIMGPLPDSGEKEADKIAEAFEPLPVEKGKKRTRRTISYGTGTSDNLGFGISGKSSRLVSDTLKSSGRPIDDSVRLPMESWFNQDFSGVRIHDDPKASESAKAVKAIAYTVGRDIVFKNGAYAPDTPDGSRLLAHELAHVVQQQGIKGFQRKPEEESVDSGGGTKISPQGEEIMRLIEGTEKVYGAYRTKEIERECIQFTDPRVGRSQYTRAISAYSDAVDATEFKSTYEYEAAIKNFEIFFRDYTCTVALQMLDENEKLVKAETERYGLPDRNGDDSALLQLGALIKPMLDKALEYRAKTGILVATQTDVEVIERPSPEADQLDEQIKNIIIAASVRFPVLADPKLDLYMFVNGNAAQIRNMLKSDSDDRLKDIQKSRKDITDNRENIWSLDNAIEQSCKSLYIEKESVFDLIIRDKISSIEKRKTVRDLFLGAVSIGIAIGTAGAGAIVEFVGAAGIAAISTAIVIENTEEHFKKAAFYGSAFDKAQALSKDEPGLFWLAMDIIGAFTDIWAAAKAFKGITKAIKDLMKIRDANSIKDLINTQSANALEEQARKVAQDIGVDGDKLADVVVKAAKKEKDNIRLLENNKELAEKIRNTVKDIDEPALVGILKLPEKYPEQLLAKFSDNHSALINLGHLVYEFPETIKAVERIKNAFPNQYENIIEYLVTHRKPEERELLSRIGKTDFNGEELKNLLSGIENVSGKQKRVRFKEVTDETDARLRKMAEEAEASRKLLEEKVANQIIEATKLKDEELAGIIKLPQKLRKKVMNIFEDDTEKLGRLGQLLNESEDILKAVKTLGKVLSKDQLSVILGHLISSESGEFRDLLRLISKSGIDSNKLKNFMETKRIVDPKTLVKDLNEHLKKSLQGEIAKARKELLEKNKDFINDVIKVAPGLDNAQLAGIAKLPEGIRKQVLNLFGGDAVGLGRLGKLVDESEDALKTIERLSNVFNQANKQEQFEKILKHLMSDKVSGKARNILSLAGEADLTSKQLADLLKGMLNSKLKDKKLLVGQLRSALEKGMEVNKQNAVAKLLNKNKKLVDSIRVATNVDRLKINGIFKLPENIQKQIIERFGEDPKVIGNLGQLINKSADTIKAMERLHGVLEPKQFEAFIGRLMSLKDEKSRDILRLIGKADLSPEEIEIAIKTAETSSEKVSMSIKLEVHLEEAAKTKILTVTYQKLEKSLQVLKDKYPILKNLNEDAFKRIIEKIAYVREIKPSHVQQMKGQLFEELLTEEMKSMLASKAGKTKLGLDGIKGEIEYIPGHQIKIVGSQFTDGIIVIRNADEKELQVIMITEAKAGKKSAGGLASKGGDSKDQLVAYKDVVKDLQLDEYKREIVEEIFGNENKLKIFFDNNRELVARLGKFDTPEEFATFIGENHSKALGMFKTSDDAIKVGNELRIAPENMGQVGLDIERGLELEDKIEIKIPKYRDWKVTVQPKLKIIGVVPKDVYESLINKFKNIGNIYNFDAMPIGINQDNLMGIANDLRKAVE